MLVGMPPFPHALVCDVAWLFLYASAFSGLTIETAAVASNNAAIAATIAKLRLFIIIGLFVFHLSEFGEKRLPNKSYICYIGEVLHMLTFIASKIRPFIELLGCH